MVDLLMPEMLVVLLLAAALCAFVAMVFGYTGFWLVRNWFAPTTRVQARVARRHSKQWDFSITGDTPEMSAARLGMLGRCRKAATRAYIRLAGAQDVPEISIVQGTDFFVTFAFNDREIEFNVPMDDYIKCEEGAEGLLVYKGEKFRHFIRGLGS